MRKAMTLVNYEALMNCITATVFRSIVAFYVSWHATSYTVLDSVSHHLTSELTVLQDQNSQNALHLITCLESIHHVSVTSSAIHTVVLSLVELYWCFRFINIEHWTLCIFFFVTLYQSVTWGLGSTVLQHKRCFCHNQRMFCLVF